MDTPLNKAHFYARKSLQYSGNDKIKYLQSTIEQLKIALKQSTNAKTQDSITQQIGYYERQLKLVTLRKALNDKCEKPKNPELSETSDVSYSISINEHVDKTTDIQLDLLKNLEESYKIIEDLNRLENPEMTSQVAQLQNLNSQLNLMFHKLSVSIEEVLRENELLRDKTKSLGDAKNCSLSEKEELSKENNEQRDSDDSSQEIQDLPPLELPTFNIDDK